jgi:hypothetical protein
MGESKRRQASLELGLSQDEFAEALLSMIGEVRDSYEGSLHVEKKRDLQEHSLSLLMANAACGAIGQIEEAINTIRESVKQKPL